MTDPILQAIDAAIEAEENAKPPRNYLGMSSIGRSCARALWYQFRHAKAPSRRADLIKAASDGHAGEALMAERLRMVEGIKLVTEDSRTGKQFEFSDIGGHFRGHNDGYIRGLPHHNETDEWNPTDVWEHKQVNEKKFNQLVKLIEQNEGDALEKWDYSYYGQACLYLYYAGLTRHYLTVSTPGSRQTISCRTSANEEVAQSLIKKAERIIYSDTAPERVSNNPSWFECKWCEFSDICHDKKTPQMNCRTCLHASPEEDGHWSCAKLNEPIENTMPCGGEKHLYLPDMLGSKAVEATEDSVLYADGRTNFEGGKVE